MKIEFVSIKERKPQLEGSYFVIIDGKEPEVAYFIVKKSIQGFPEKTMEFDDGCCCRDFLSRDITHWASFPNEE